MPQVYGVLSSVCEVGLPARWDVRVWSQAGTLKAVQTISPKP